MSAVLKLKCYLWCQAMNSWYTDTTLTVCRLHVHTKMEVRKSKLWQNFTNSKKLIGDNAKTTGNYQSLAIGKTDPAWHQSNISMSWGYWAQYPKQGRISQVGEIGSNTPNHGNRNTEALLKCKGYLNI